MSTQRERRWLRISLRSFFVMFTVACVWLGFVVNRARLQQQTVQWLKEQGDYNYVGYELIDSNGHALSDKQGSVPAWLRDRIGIDCFETVKKVVINEQMGGRPHSDLTPLANLTKLNCLSAGGQGIRDLKPLEKLTHLTELELECTSVSDISPLRNLTRLNLLDLSWARVSDITVIANLEKLTYLDLSGTWVSDLSPLANLTHLTELRLTATSCSDVTPLYNLPNLKTLDLTDSLVSYEDYRRLCNALPNCSLPWCYNEERSTEESEHLKHLVDDMGMDRSHARRYMLQCRAYGR